MLHTVFSLALLVGANDMTVSTLGSGTAVRSEDSVSKTTAGVTLAVTTDGDDDNPSRPSVITTGDYSSYPFATIQAALDALPSLISYPTTITVGVGSFAGALISNIGIKETTTLTIAGIRQASSPATGPSSGTASSGSTGVLTLAGAGWTVDDLQGRILYVTAGTGAGEYVIATNSATDITVPNVVTFDATSVFQIEDLATVITSPRSGYSGGYVFEIYRNNINVILSDLKITYSSPQGVGVFTSYGDAIAQRVVVSVTDAYDGFKSFSGGRLAVFNCGFFGTTDHAGFTAYGADAILHYKGVAADSIGYSMRAVYGGQVTDSGDGGFWFRATTRGVLLDDCNRTARITLLNGHIEGAQYGIHSTDCSANINGLDIDDTTVVTIYMDRSEIISSGTLTGTGNVWGLDLSSPGSLVYFSTAPTITGSSGDVTLDGSTATTWSSAGIDVTGLFMTGASRVADHFYAGPGVDPTDFPTSTIVVSSGDSHSSSSSSNVGVVSEAVADAASGKGGIGFLSYGETDGAKAAYGGFFEAHPGSSGDTGAATALYLQTTATHAGGRNAGLSVYVTGGTPNHSIEIFGGDVSTEYYALDWDLKDKDSSSLSFDTAGKPGLLNFDTTDGDEGISTSGWFSLGAGTVLSSPVDGGLLVTNSTGSEKFAVDNNGTMTQRGHLKFEIEKTGLTDAASNDFVRISVPQGGHVGGTVIYSIHAGDAGGDLQARNGVLTFAAVNKAGAETCDVQIAAASEALAASAGTLTASFGCASNAADTVDLSVTPNSSLTPTTLEIHYQVHLDHDYTITAL